MSDIIRLPNGTEVFLGLNVDPNGRQNIGVSYTEAQLPLYDDKQIIEIISDPNRIPSRRRFDSKFWIGRQINSGCNGWAWAGALGKSRVRRGLQPIRLSGDFAYSQMNGGVDEGSQVKDGRKVAEGTGICQYELVKVGTYRKRDIAQEAYVNAARFKLSANEWYRVDTRQELYSALALGFELVVAVHVDNDFTNVSPKGVIPPSRTGVGNHAVNLDDVVVVDGRLMFDLPNSWGTNFGIDGRGYGTWEDHLVTTVHYHEFIAIRSTIDDPQGTNPPPATA